MYLLADPCWEAMHKLRKEGGRERVMGILNCSLETVGEQSPLESFSLGLESVLLRGLDTVGFLATRRNNSPGNSRNLKRIFDSVVCLACGFLSRNGSRRFALGQHSLARSLASVVSSAK